MYIMRMLAGLLLSAVLSACGGGGGSPGTVGSGGTGGTGGTTNSPAVALQLVDASGAATTTVSETQTTFARATVLDANGTPVGGTVVTFRGDAALVAFVPSTGTALTGPNGVAQVQVVPASGSAAGAGLVRADATVGSTAAKQGTAGFQVLSAGGVPTATLPTALELFASSPQLSATPNATVSFTVAVKDAQNRAMPGQTVTFSATSGDLSGALPARVTGSAGEPVTGVVLSPGADRSNRDIVLTATSGAVRQTLTVAVTGTVISLIGENSILLGGTSTFVVSARDAAGQAIAGAAITPASSLGNTISPAALTTDSLGAARFSYRGDKPGLDTITIRGLGTSATANIAVSAEDFAFETPAAATPIPIGTAQTATVRLLSGGAPAAGRAVTFSTTRGTLSVSSGVTDANGRVSTSASSDTSGPATLVARAGTAQTLLPVTFLATNPVSLVLQANPGAVAPNAGGSTVNKATLLATVRDPGGNPVAGRVVNFTALSDLSNGTISPGSGVTDTNGQIGVQFVPGALSTASNGVQIQATVQDTSVFGTASLTVSTQALFISIGRGKLLGETTDPVYKKEFSVYVTDANGAAAPNKTVTLSVWPEQYLKGTWAIGPSQTGTALKWVAGVSATCANEDRDRSGIYSVAKDANQNGKLDPGLPIVVSPPSVTTDASGFATFFLQYGKNFGSWLDTTVTARASVAGTESVQTQAWTTDISAEDVNDTTTTPPFQVSPFGTTGSCSSPN